MKKFIAVLISLSIFYCQTIYAGVTFDVLDDSISCGTTDDILKENAALTIAAAIFPNTVGENGFGRIISRHDSVGGGEVFLCTTATATLSFRVNGGTQLVRTSSNGSITLGAWNIVIVTWDGGVTASNVHIYVANAANSWVLTETSYATTTNGVTPTDNSAGTTYIGTHATGSRTFDGPIEAIDVFNSVVSNLGNLAVRLKRMGFKNSVQPKMYLALDECTAGATCSTAGMFRDLTGNGHNCSPANSPVGAANNILSYPPQGVQVS